jgi:uroporphyrinogen-III synthase
MHEVDKQEVISNVESVLLVLGNLAPDSLMLKIKEITSRVKRIDVYRTSYVKSVYSEFKELIENDDYSIIVFTSPSGFDNFLQHFGKYINNKENLRIASIGKTTSRFISLRGFPITLESPKSTFEDLAESIYKYLKK